MVALAVVAALILHAEYFSELPGATSLEESLDPCRDKVCQVGARCVVSLDGLSAFCECPTSCHAFGDGMLEPVCGTDLQEYPDHCALMKAACVQHKDIRVKFKGPCDPCAETECPEPEVCALGEHRQPECRCTEVCPDEFAPVCGSDGRTYSNTCRLRREGCRTRRELRIVYRGRCNAGENPCAGLHCAHGQLCNVGRDGVARCECPPECELVARPVCGSDARTYDSACHLTRQACLAKANVSVAYTGPCGVNGPCSAYTCSHGAECVPRNGAPRCVCPRCPVTFQPVCGSDGVSYGNECRLRLEACQRRLDLHVVHQGLCSCENRSCGPHAKCETDATGEGQCVCPDCDGDAEQQPKPVCGTDGVTYPNECAMRREGCKEGRNVAVAYKGDCDACRDVKCQEGARCEEGACSCETECGSPPGPGLPGVPGAVAVREAVCGSDRVTYPSECDLKKASCKRHPEPAITVLFYGDCLERFGEHTATMSPVQANLSAKLMEGGKRKEVQQHVQHVSTSTAEACKDIRCDYDATCELGTDAFPRCSCVFDCGGAAWGGAGPRGPVCASNQRMYPSMCEMKRDGCQRQEELRLRPLDLCKGLEVKPCGGQAAPLKDPAGGGELDCGAGPQRQDCPRGSYCHQTPHFARCCPKTGTFMLHESCEESWFGCCPDGRTLAEGPDAEGCPKLCGCNKLGAVSDACDPDTDACVCKAGVGGEKCDRCEPAYWGLQKVRDHGNPSVGCLPCSCHKWGAVRDDCEQMTGRCVCRPGVQGDKCEECVAPTHVLSPAGCGPPGAGGVPATATERPLKRSTLHRFTEPGPGPGQGGGSSFKSTRHLGLSAPPPLDPRHPQHRYYYSATNRSGGGGGDLLVPDGDTAEQDGGDSREVDVIHSLAASSSSSTGGDLLEGNATLPTPAPPAPPAPPALLGDECSSSSDCGVQHSHCLHGACTCLEQPEGHERHERHERHGRNHCPAPASTAAPTSACLSSPCDRGAVCVEDPLDSFTCLCNGEPCGGGGPDFLDNSTAPGLSFSGESWLRTTRLEASHALSVDVEFLSFAPDGVLLYSQQQEDGSGDFVSLALVGGFVEFRYNLGSGTVVLRSAARLAPHAPHRVSAKRYHRDGVLSVDGESDVTGQSQGSLRALDLGPAAWVGAVPTNHTRVWENIGTSQGFTGCIRRLAVGQRRVDLAGAVSSSGVGQCGGDPCSAQPCRHGGVCHPSGDNAFKCECTLNFTGLLCEAALDACLASPCSPGSTCLSVAGGFTCQCLPGRRGKTCQIADDVDAEPVVPVLDGHSYLTLPRLEGVGRAFSLELWFLARVPDGALLYDGQRLSSAGRGDFIALSLRGGRVDFRFDLGSGPARIVSEEVAEPGVWHSVRISRTDRAGSLQLDNGTVARGLSGAPLNELNLDLPLYVGGVPSTLEVNPESGISSTPGLVGAVQRLVVNGHTYSPLGALAAHLPRYRGPPCEPPGGNPNATLCAHGGLCLPLLNTFACRCQPGFTGTHCHQRDTSVNGTLSLTARAVKFSGDTFLHFRGPKPQQHSLNLTAMSAPNGSAEAVEAVDASLASYEEVAVEEAEEWEEADEVVPEAEEQHVEEAAEDEDEAARSADLSVHGRVPDGSAGRAAAVGGQGPHPAGRLPGRRRGGGLPAALLQPGQPAGHAHRPVQGARERRQVAHTARVPTEAHGSDSRGQRDPCARLLGPAGHAAQHGAGALARREPLAAAGPSRHLLPGIPRLHPVCSGGPRHPGPQQRDAAAPPDAPPASPGCRTCSPGILPPHCRAALSGHTCHKPL